jgi:NADH-quinone oxidoreductase subunit I
VTGRPARARGVIALVEENCTVCMLCVRECPDWCIEIEGHTETLPPDEVHRRSRTENVLDRFAIDFARCLYCGICVEVCPFDALHWSPVPTDAGPTLAGLTHERGTLSGWEATVASAPALDPGAASTVGSAPSRRSPAGS